MGEQIYKDFFEEAMTQIREEYIAMGKERDFKFYFNLEYIEDTFDSITVSVPSEFMWKQMTKNGSAEKIQQKINELTAQEIKLIPIPKNSQAQKVSQTASFTQTELQTAQGPKKMSQGLLKKTESITAQISTPIQDSENQENTLFPPEKKAETKIQQSRFANYKNAMDSLNQLIEMEKQKIEQNQNQQKNITNDSSQIFYSQQPQIQPQMAQTIPQQISQSQILPQIQVNQPQNYESYNSDYQQYLEQEVMKMQQRNNHPLLSAEYTFDNFIPGANSQYAYSAAKRAAEAPGKDFNPILIYGGVGLGKTHLMQAIGNYIYSKDKNAKIIYISAEAFTNEFTYCLRTKKMEEFKKKYRKLNVLLLDDIQFLVGKDATQEELFHTFNAIYDVKGQLVFTCDRPITEIKGITDRLRTRFSRGLNIDLQPPDYETRRAILEQKMNNKGRTISPEVLDYVAQNIQSNIRDLESSMIKMIGYCELIEKPLTIETAKELLKDKLDAENVGGSVSVEAIQKAVAKHYGLKLTDLIGQKRSKQYVLPRHIAIYLCRKLVSEYSLKDIGNEFGGRDHTSISNACEKIETMIKVNSEIATVVKEIEKEAREID